MIEGGTPHSLVDHLWTTYTYHKPTKTYIHT